MIETLSYIAEFVARNFLHIWPYLLFSIPLAVLVRVTNAQKYIKLAFGRRPMVSILLATAVGAFSPFCSCTVIPIISALLIAGVPIGPVMAFWIASPTMDPEIFLLSVGMLGPELAVMRVVATLILSISAGVLAQILEQRGFFAEGILRSKQQQQATWSWRRGLRVAFDWLRGTHAMQPAPAVAAGPVQNFIAMGDVTLNSVSRGGSPAASCGCDVPADPEPACGCSESACSAATTPAEESLWPKLRRESWDATVMVVRFMLVAFLLEALINLYVPQEAIVALVGTGNPLAILMSALIGVPIYTSNLTALPLVGGLLDQGMLPGAAIAFLIAGPTTTIPAMSAVFGIARPRVFAIYVGVALVGAVLLGYAYQIGLSLV